MPRFMLFLHTDPDNEAGNLPSHELFEQMHAFNTEMKAAGVMLAAEGLHASSKGARVTFPPADPADPNKLGPREDIKVTPGPFALDNDHKIVCGFWIIKTKNLEEAVEWAKRAPVATSLEVRQVQELEDLGDLVPDHVKKEEGQWKAESEGKRA